MQTMKAHGTVQISYSYGHFKFLALVIDGDVSSDSLPGRFIPGENIPIIGEYEAGWYPPVDMDTTQMG